MGDQFNQENKRAQIRGLGIIMKVLDEIGNQGILTNRENFQGGIQIDMVQPNHTEIEGRKMIVGAHVIEIEIEVTLEQEIVLVKDVKEEEKKDHEKITVGLIKDQIRIKNGDLVERCLIDNQHQELISNNTNSQ